MKKKSNSSGSESGKKKLFVHIGMHKTGTTSIQSALHSLADQLFIRDYLYPTAGRHPREYRSHALLPHLLGVPSPKHGPMRLTGEIDHEAMLRSLRNEVDISGLGNVILSSEDLWTVSESGIDQLQQLFQDFDIIPVLFVRHPAKFSMALYQTMIRYGHIDSSEIAAKKQFWLWLGSFDVMRIVEKWSAIAMGKQVMLVDYDKSKFRSCELFFNAVGLPSNIPGLEKAWSENRSEPAAVTFLRQELLASGVQQDIIEGLIRQLARAPMMENQTLIPADQLERLNRSYADQCKKIRSSAHVRLVQPDGFEPSDTTDPVYIGTMSGVVFAIGRAMAALSR